VASPVAHSFAGFWTFLLLVAKRKIWLSQQWRQYLPHLVVLVLLANLADVDFFIGHHRGPTHSLEAAIFVALAFAWIWQIAPGFWPSVAFYFIAYGSHLLIDLVTGTELGWNKTSHGIPLFWPARDISSPLVLVFGVRQNPLLSIENVWSAFYELLVFGAITAVILALRARKVLNA
jgi:membrane-bound metal-dependent hydrolase YbcI (DUF457 family)